MSKYFILSYYYHICPPQLIWNSSACRKHVLGRRGIVCAQAEPNWVAIGPVSTPLLVIFGSSIAGGSPARFNQNKAYHTNQLEVLGGCNFHYWGNLKRFLYHTLTLPIQHTQMWILCQNHMRTCNSLLWSLFFLCIGVAHQLVRPREREPHQSHQCNPNYCHKNTMWNEIRGMTIKINWIKSSQDTKFTKYLEIWPISF